LVLIFKGLFFSARTNPDGSLPNSSPFGDIRMVKIYEYFYYLSFGFLR
jgi:hypothetical protein